MGPQINIPYVCLFLIHVHKAYKRTAFVYTMVWRSMNTGCICSTGDDVQPSQQTVTLLAGTSSVQQSYTINDNSVIDRFERRFIVEAVIQDPTLADFTVGNDPDNLQDRDSAIFTIRDDDHGELLRDQHHNCVFVLPVKLLSFMFSLKFGCSYTFHQCSVLPGRGTLLSVCSSEKSCQLQVYE